MPKRKNSRSLEEDINHYKHKIRKLERKIRDRQVSSSESVSDLEEAVVLQDVDIGAGIYLLINLKVISLRCSHRLVYVSTY